MNKDNAVWWIMMLTGFALVIVGADHASDDAKVLVGAGLVLLAVWTIVTEERKSRREFTPSDPTIDRSVKVNRYGWGRYDGMSAERSDTIERPDGVGWFPLNMYGEPAGGQVYPPLEGDDAEN